MSGLMQRDFEREIASMVGELRDVTIDAGSFLARATGATNEQRLALARLAHDYRPRCMSLYCTIGGAGLPNDYVLFELRDALQGSFLVGGIDPAGHVST